MANIATTASVVDHTSDAAFRTWVAEIISTFTSTLTLVQTTDTGQINTSTVTRPGTANNSAGYAIFRFSDTLQATNPVFIRLDFGSGATVGTNPQMWVQIGTSTNGAGTITGTKTLTQACFYSGAPSNTVTSYTSRFVCNMTLGYVGLAWKLTGSGTTTAFYGGFQIYRSNDTTGASSGDCAILMSSGVPTSVTFPTMNAGTTSNMGYMQCLSYSSLLIYPPTPSNGNLWQSSGGESSSPLPFNITSTSVSGNAQVFPVVYMAPVLNYSAFACYGLLAEQPLGTTFSVALVGSTALTFISIGQPWGSSYLGVVSTSVAGFNMLWQ